MNEGYINEALSRLDAPSIEAALNYRKPRIGYRVIAAAAAALMIGVGAYAFLKASSPKTTPKTDMPNKAASCGGTDGMEAGGAVTGGAIVSDKAVTVTGTAPAPEEIRALVEREKNMIAAYVRTEYREPLGELRIATVGYSHLRTPDNTVALDYIDLPVFSGSKVVASVTLYTVEGELFYSIAAGGSGWERISAVLNKYPNDKICFVYAGQYMEVMIAPDNSVYPVGEGYDDPFAGEDAPYEKYASQYNCFSLSEIFDSKAYVSAEP